MDTVGAAYGVYLAGLKHSDKHFTALSQHEQESIAGTCIEYGKERARALIQQYGSSNDFESLKSLAYAQGVTVTIIRSKDMFPFLAEYTPKNKKIELYSHRIEEVQTALALQNPEYFEKCSLDMMCLAHELFHHLERLEFGTTGRLACIRITRLGLKHYLAEGSEVAAHSFVSELLGLEFTTYTFAEELKKIYDGRRSAALAGASAELTDPNGATDDGKL